MDSGDRLEIEWYGQAMFKISGGGIALVCDPAGPATGYRYEHLSADIVIISHQHHDHNYLAGVKGTPRVLAESGTFTIEGLSITGIASFHDARMGAERGENVIFTWKQAGFSIGHLGDLGHHPDPDILARLKGLDVMMVPVGGVFTIDGSEAARLVSEAAPSIAIPMHYKTPDCKIPLEPVDGFRESFPGTVREIGKRPLTIGREDLPAGPEAWVLPCS